MACHQTNRFFHQWKKPTERVLLEMDSFEKKFHQLLRNGLNKTFFWVPLCWMFTWCKMLLTPFTYEERLSGGHDSQAFCINQLIGCNDFRWEGWTQLMQEKRKPFVDDLFFVSLAEFLQTMSKSPRCWKHDEWRQSNGIIIFICLEPSSMIKFESKKMY